MLLLVNMVPRSMSRENAQDSEPSIAVNPANPQQIVGTAFTPDPFGGPFAPIYVSTDGGNTWVLNFNVPSQTMTGDITVAFGSAGNRLYAGILRRPNPAPNVIRMNILRTTNFLSPTPMKVLEDRNEVDQPFVQALTIAGKDRVYVGGNDFNANDGKTATIDRFLNAGIVKPSKKSIRIEARDTGSANQNGPAIRPACHPDGTAYGVFYGWRSFNRLTRQVTADVVVVRDDNSGARANSFRALVDQADGLSGQRVAQNVTFTWNAFLGQQRIGGDVAIAVDPTNSQNVYVAWADQQPTGYTLHVRRSTTGGQTWSPADLRTIVNGVNPALAINSVGKVGFLYQQVQGNEAAARWVTQFDTTTDGGASWTNLVLATVPAGTPAPQFQPYIGDYDQVLAVDQDFYGIFAANNTPDHTNFPNGVTYQRNADFNTHTLLGTDNTTVVPVSIDPFFFKITPE
jgi:hypothetical protein